MARPHKRGVDYWSFDCDFFEDKKIRLIRSEYGIKGVFVTIMLLNSVYKGEGYFKKWDKDDCFLVSQGADSGISPKFVEEIVNVCIRRQIFDKQVFDMYGVLTSHGIQRRFLRMVGNSREEVPFIKEYLLLDLEDISEVPAGILSKLVFKGINGTENSQNFPPNPKNSTENTQSKVNKIKENEIKSNKVNPTLPPVQKAVITLPFADGEHNLYPEDIEDYKRRYTDTDVDSELTKIRAWLTANPHKAQSKSTAKKLINTWLCGENRESAQLLERSHDAEEFFRAAVEKSMSINLWQDQEQDL